jgi:hypothetical protein
MAKTMTTSGMTEKQINRACEIFRAQLTKHAPELSSDAVQWAFGDRNLPKEWLESLRTRVEAISELIVRHVTVDRSRTNKQAIDATGRVQYVNKDVLATMPRCEGEEVDVYLFPTKRTSSPAEVAEAYRRHGLKPDPIAVAKVNEDDPTFADQHPNACQWQDSEGRWSYVAFNQWHGGKRSVRVYRVGSDWYDGWLLGGVRK